MLLPTAYAAEPANTGTASNPVPTIPRLKRRKANCPASGRRDSAASAAEPMSVLPLACKVSAVVKIMKNATILEAVRRWRPNSTKRRFRSPHSVPPGITDTDFFEKANAENIRGRQSSNVMSPEEVAKVGYKAMIDGELFIVPGGINKAMVAARRIISVGLQAKLNERINEDVPSKDRKHHRGEKEEAVSPWRRSSC